MNELNLSDLTSEQIDKMKHALGLNYKRRPYRNYFYLTTPSEEWEDLVNKGFAVKQEGMKKGSVYYFLTFQAVKLVYGKNISEKFYNEL